jgi:hypothetical protein
MIIQIHVRARSSACVCICLTALVYMCSRHNDVSENRASAGVSHHSCRVDDSFIVQKQLDHTGVAVLGSRD